MLEIRPASWMALLIAAGCLASSRPAAAQPADRAEAWLADLYEDVAADLIDGKPLVVQVHVPLCDNDVLRCGNDRLGNGDDPDRNLYWATSGGFRGWFGRRGSGWTEVHRGRGPEADVLEVRVWRRQVAPGGALRARGVRRSFPVYVVATAWRGEAIQSAMAAFAADLYGTGEARRVALSGGGARGTVIEAGAAAQVVAFVGHNGWMDVSAVSWPVSPPGARRKGAIAIACLTEDYLADEVPAERRVPLLFTRSLLFAGAHSLEGAVRAFAEGRGLLAIRDGAAEAYAAGQDKPVARARAAFTNPADRRWKRRSR